MQPLLQRLSDPGEWKWAQNPGPKNTFLGFITRFNANFSEYDIGSTQDYQTCRRPNLYKVGVSNWESLNSETAKNQFMVEPLRLPVMWL